MGSSQHFISWRTKCSFRKFSLAASRNMDWHKENQFKSSALTVVRGSDAGQGGEKQFCTFQEQELATSSM